MRCIFCKLDSSKSKSVEHIIPESLGNKINILPKGVVCDYCNNYFARKVEKVVLEMPYFQSLRGRKMIENKKGKIPNLIGYTENKEPVRIVIPSNEYEALYIEIQDLKAFESIKNQKIIHIPYEMEPPKNDIYISKFLGKIALEVLAKRVSECDGWQEDFVNNSSLDELRKFVRFGEGYTFWPYYTRRIYGEDKIWYDNESDKMMETINEYDFLIPDSSIVEGEYLHMSNLYFVMAILGIEYTINMTNAGLDRYIKWLSDNKSKSILLIDKNEL